MRPIRARLGGDMFLQISDRFVRITDDSDCQMNGVNVSEAETTSTRRNDIEIERGAFLRSRVGGRQRDREEVTYLSGPFDRWLSPE
jgi:hypothetical protein